MMTKYQNVYTRLETLVWNIARTTEAKKQLRIQQAFRRMADNVRLNKVKLANKQKLVFTLFQNKLGQMVSTLERFTMQKRLQSSFSQWKSVHSVNQLSQAARAEAQEELS